MARLLTDKQGATPRAKAPASMPYLASRVFNTPLLIHPKKLDAILSAIGPRLNLRQDMIPKTDETMVHKRDEGGGEPVGPVAVIPVYGTLVKRSSWMDADSGLTSYDSLRSKVGAAMANPQVKSLLFDIDSPGGEAAGLFDFCSFLTGLRGTKPMVGIANDMAFSAAYAVASCMDKLFLTAVGGVGSIGVYMLHTDQSRYDDKVGVTYTYIYSGDKKVDGNPHAPMSKSALKDAQAEVDRIRDMFVALVAKNRNAKADDVHGTEAGTFMGSLALPLLADAVGTYDDAASAAMSSVKGSRSVSIPEPGATGHIIVTSDEGAAIKALLKEAAHSEVFAADAMASIAKKDGYAHGLLAMRNYGTLRLSKTNDSKGDRISGLLAPYNSLSCNLGGFYEVYQPGCFAEFLESQEDALVLAFHNPEKVLGRSSNNTARFWEEADGLHYEADLPDTQCAKDLKVLIERGDVRGSSAAFYILQHRWEQRASGRVRIIEKAKLVEGSPHSFAAYEGSTAQTVAQEDQLAAIHETEHAKAKLRRLRLT